MTQDSQDLAQPERRRLIMAIAAVAGLASTMKLPVLLDAGGDLLRHVLEALGQEAGPAIAMSNSAIEFQLNRILRAPLAVLASPQDLKQRIRSNIEADYLAGDIRIVDGWWLSATEANCLELIQQARAG